MKHNHRIKTCLMKDEILEVLKSSFFLFIYMYSIILVYFAFFRQSITSNLISTIQSFIFGPKSLFLLLLFPFLFALMPEYISRFKKKTPASIRLKISKCLCFIVLSFFMIYSIDSIEHTVANKDIAGFDEIVRATDKDRKSHFLWLRFSLGLVCVSSIMAVTKKEIA